MAKPTFDFSHLTETREVDMGGWTVTVREVPHGEMTRLQDEMLGDIQLGGSKRQVERQMQGKTLKPATFNDRRTLLAIASWTLQDAQGCDVPVCLEAWHALPGRITDRIEEVIDELNPSLDDDDKSEAGDGSAD